MSIHTIWQVVRTLLLVLLLTGWPAAPARSAEEATFTVNSLADTNDHTCNAASCTLREAVEAANASTAEDTIQFSIDGTITLGSILPTITVLGNLLTIDGANHSVTINGNNHDRIFYISSSAHLTLRDLTLSNGYMNYGGAIYNDGTLILEDCTLTGNHAMNHGGAIYQHFGSLTTINTNFTENSVDTGSGGAIYIESSTVHITGGVFQHNVAAYSGGAIYNDYYLTVSGASFLLNIASGGSGGALDNEWEVTIEDAIFGLNSAEEYGGAVYTATGGNFTIYRSTFSYNLTYFYNGGGLYVSDTYGSGIVRDCRFVSNQAADDGGGAYISDGSVFIDRSSFENNEAVNGAGVFNWGGDVVVHSNTFDGNEASQHGGGFYNHGYMAISGSTFSGNSAADDGGGIYHVGGYSNHIASDTFYGNSASRGGGVFAEIGALITNCTFSDNAAAEGGSVYSSNSTELRNTILNISPGSENCEGPSTQPKDQGNNIDSGTTCSFGTTYDSMSSTDPLLGPLKNNGGLTKTMMIQTGSPAVDGVTYNSPNDCPDRDQRGYLRPYGAACDIGAVEQYFPVYAPLVVLDTAD